jgi:hypothetical protein
VRLAPPNDEHAPSKTIDWTASDDAERAIAAAREALVGLDFTTAEQALTRAEGVLHDHPELPQAAWLLAEVERTWAARWLRDTASTAGLEKARFAWQRAAALDGGRAAGLGEKAFDVPAVTASIRLETADDGTSLLIDGQPVAAGDVKREEGEHAVVLVRSDGAIGWAAWVPWKEGVVVQASAPGAPPCSRDDVGRARVVGRAIVGAGIQCARWVAAIAGDAGVVRVATCSAGACDPLVEWRVTSSASWTYAPVAPVETKPRWPAWATWTIAGVGVVGAAVAVVVASGALKSPQTQTEFVNGGLKVH